MIGLAVPDAGLKPGDVVDAIVSKGPDMVDIPNFTGMTIAAAMARLTELGMVPSTNTPEEYRDQLLVKSQSTTGLTKRGSTVTVYNP